jgi:acetoin utilization deacetylase AcuC-like enzyme
MNTALFAPPSGLDHDTGPGHPESPARLAALQHVFQQPGLAEFLINDVSAADHTQLLRVHTSSLIHSLVAKAPSSDRRVVDADTVIAHQNDPLAHLQWHDADYAWLTQQLCRVAAETAQRRIVSCLEGGYNITALTASVLQHVHALMEAA